ncbi:MAG TPA: zinc-dependent metalloprotease, partial [Thermoanaerobaculia bacterium]|nr:zinc-dependent metalloprotease [Thermoanaerobaculia bacterium]
MKPARSAGALVPWFATLLWVACASSTRPPAGAGGEAVEANASAGFAQRVEGLELRRGLIDLYPDAERGRLLAAFPAPSGAGGEIGEYLYSEALRTGLGSNPVGLDRGQLGGAWRIRIRRLGGRVLIEVPNLRFRALAGDEPEIAAVRESFATSVIWAGEILASDPSGRLLVDLTGFALRDAHDVSRRLASAGQGSFSLDGARSVIDLEACRSFERNVEIESLLTFSGSAPGDEVRAVAPDPRAVSLVLHQTIAQLPPSGYRPRPLDFRMGFWGVGFSDYAAPLDEPVERIWAARHRLRRGDREATGSDAVDPIVYYVDRAAPEPVRSSLVDGASWWARAFEAAGFEDGFRVELLPEGADPLDLRYNVVQWVHRATRGWSYGGAVVDPLTGEIVKGHVSLGSLRVRQDRLLLEGLLGARPATGPDPVALALARIRQLAAHEVGHTLGLAHNFAGSARGRASVMDYPAPRIRIAGDGGLDLSEAYAVGVGAWDVAAIRWAYSEPPDGTTEAQHLEGVVAETLARDLVFLSDSDARPLGSAHPLASLWDDGADPVSSLETAMRVRALALSRFGPGSLAPGQPLARLDEILATVYLHHRYQVDATAKLVGGVDYRHALRGDGQPAARPVDAESQRRALDALLAALDPAALDLPEPLLRQLAPRAPELGESPERFGSRTAPAFDALGAAATAADLVLRALLEPARAARLVDQHRRSPALPGLDELLG